MRVAITKQMQTLNPMKLTGSALLEYFDANRGLSYTERCTHAGYLRTLKDGSQGCNFTEFFEAILDARNEGKELPKNGADWYDSLSDQDRELYDAIEDMCPEFSKLTAEYCQEFMDQLAELGITTETQFNDAYFWQVDNTWRAEAEFAEYVTTEVNCINLPDYVSIDWQDTWDSALRYDFSTIQFDGETYFFSNHF